MKVYEAVFNQAKNKGVWGISLVEDPAMEGEFLALSKQTKIELKTLDEEQRIIIGLVLEPNKKIFRNQGGEEFEIFFSEDTIKDLSHNFFKQGYQTNSSIEHSNSIEGVSFVESWIVLDSNNDKSNALGFNYPKGSWIATMKVDSDEVWEEYVKDGKVKGFSIDAFVELQEVKLNKDKQMDKTILEAIKDIPNAIKLALTPPEKKEDVKDEEIKLGSINSADGMVFIYDGETPEVGGAIWILAEDGETRVPVPVGEHALEGGGTLVVAEEGIIESVGAAEAEAPAELEEAGAAAPSAPAADVIEQIKSVLIKYTEDAKTERLEFEKMIDEKLKGYEGKLVEFSEQPAEKPTKSAPTQKAKGLTEFLNNNL